MILDDDEEDDDCVVPLSSLELFMMEKIGSESDLRL